MKSTYHMPSVMKALCSKVMEQSLGQLVPTDLEMAALRWAKAQAAKHGQMDGNAFWWWDRQNEVWLRFGRRLQHIEVEMQLGVSQAERPQEVTA